MGRKDHRTMNQQLDIYTLRYLRDVIQGTIQPPDGNLHREGEAFARRGIVEMIDAMIADAHEPDWIPVSKLPEKSEWVQWLCADGVEDVGFYRSETESFESFDLRSEAPITHWKPLFTPRPESAQNNESK